MNRKWRRSMTRRGLTPQQIERLEYRTLHEVGQIEDSAYWRDISRFGSRSRRLVVDLATQEIRTDTSPRWRLAR